MLTVNYKNDCANFTDSLPSHSFIPGEKNKNDCANFTDSLPSRSFIPGEKRLLFFVNIFVTFIVSSPPF